MKNFPQLQKIAIPAATLLAGLVIGLVIGHFQVQKEQKIAHDKIAEVNKKVAYMQKMMVEERNETVASAEQRCQGDMEVLQKEKSALAGQSAALRAQVKTLEAKNSETAEASVRTKKELNALEEKYLKAAQRSKELDSSLQKVTSEKQTLQAELKQTNHDFGQCRSNNAELSVIAEELMRKYKNKGLGTVLLQGEPLTQIKKVELEQITQKYRTEIEKLKIKKN